MFKEYFNESIKVETYNTSSGYEDYSKEDIQDMLDNPDEYGGADNIPKWLGQAIRGSWYKKKRISKLPLIKKITNAILKDMVNGKIKKLEFTRDTMSITGFKTINIKDYI